MNYKIVIVSLCIFVSHVPTFVSANCTAVLKAVIDHRTSPPTITVTAKAPRNIYPTVKDSKIPAWIQRTLIDSTKSGHLIEHIKYLKGLDFDISDIVAAQHGDTLMHIAARFGHYNDVEFLIKKAPHLLNATNKHGNTPLHRAARYNHYYVVEQLIKNNADVNVHNLYEDTPLHIAVRRGHIPIVEIFLREKARLNIDFENDKKLQAMLDKGAINGSGEIYHIMEALFNGYVEPRPRPPTKLDEEIMYAIKNDDYNKVSDLIDQDPDVLYARDELWYTPLHLAILKRRDDIIELLINKGADVNTRNVNTAGDTPLHMVVQYSSAYIAELLIDKGADANIKSLYFDGWTPPGLATYINRKDMIELFLRKKDEGFNIDFNVTNNEGETPIEVANRLNNTVMNQLFSGKLPYRKNIPNKFEMKIWQPLIRGNLKEVSRMVKEEPNIVHDRTFSWRSPLHIAIKYGRYDIVEFLMENGADLNAKDMYGDTPLHMAVSKKQTIIVELFLRKKLEGFDIDFDAKNDKEETPLLLAKKLNTTAIIKLLSGQFKPRTRPPTRYGF